MSNQFDERGNLLRNKLDDNLNWFTWYLNNLPIFCMGLLAKKTNCSQFAKVQLLTDQLANKKICPVSPTPTATSTSTDPRPADFPTMHSRLV